MRPRSHAAANECDSGWPKTPYPDTEQIRTGIDFRWIMKGKIETEKEIRNHMRHCDWLPPRDSNPDMPLQRRLSYH